jgi:nitrate reductase gamma subunit
MDFLYVISPLVLLLWFCIGQIVRIQYFEGPYDTKKSVLKSWFYIWFWPIAFLIEQFTVFNNYWSSLPDE